MYQSSQDTYTLLIRFRQEMTSSNYDTCVQVYNKVCSQADQSSVG